MIIHVAASGRGASSHNLGQAFSRDFLAGTFIFQIQMPLEFFFMWPKLESTQHKSILLPSPTPPTISERCVNWIGSIRPLRSPSSGGMNIPVMRLRNRIFFWAKLGGRQSVERAECGMRMRSKSSLDHGFCADVQKLQPELCNFLSRICPVLTMNRDLKR